MAELLSEYLGEVSGIPFRYGSMDCSLFCLGWADVVTGRQGAAAWSGRYDCMLSCRAYISENGGMDALAQKFLSETYGILECERPARGNIVLGNIRSVQAFGLRISLTDIAYRLERGLMITKTSTVLREWGMPWPR